MYMYTHTEGKECAVDREVLREIDRNFRGANARDCGPRAAKNI